jgi:short-subunit dehydrogenase
MDRQTALITGASAGIGRDFTEIFAREGYSLVITARRGEILDEIKAGLEGRYNCDVTCIPLDLSEPGSAEKLFEEIRKLEIRIDVLVNNAAFGVVDKFDNIPLETYRRKIHLNMTSLTELMYLFLEDMKQRGSGRIMNVASAAGFVPGTNMAVYYATKSYVFNLSLAVALENEKTGVQVFALCPGATDSEFAGLAGADKTFAFRKFKPAESRDVAEFGYREMMHGKKYAIHGFINHLGIFMTRFFSRTFLGRVISFLHSKK